jgi:O-antigen/teichoic acid export membrane protein/anti-anti-sigma regulatory factor
VKSLHARIVSGGFVLLLGTGLATAANFLYNIAVARFLGPIGYGHATVVYTLLILSSAATLSFQIVAAKVVAQQTTPEQKHAVYRGIHRAAWGCGLLIALFLLLFQKQITNYLNLPTSTLVVLLAVGVAFYVPLGSRRGYIQGACRFRVLATNLVLEGLVRLGGSLLMMQFGFGVRGVVGANAAAVAFAYFAAVPSTGVGRVANPLLFREGVREVAQAVVFFSGTCLINNCDIVLVKHFFLPTAAGLYAAVAMVGRVIFTLSWSVVNSMFPLVAGTRKEERSALKVIAASSAMVLSIGTVLALALRFTPVWLWVKFFGAGFGLGGHFGLPYLLSLYAITTILYCLSVVVITYEMSHKIANTSWVQLAFSAVIVAGICRFHASLREVIWVQLILMIVLLVIVAVPFFRKTMADVRLEQETAAGDGPIRILRRVSEDEVICDFLKNDFNSPAFHSYRDSLNHLVTDPDFSDPTENAKRRALLFIRHVALWKELPADTEWYEVEVRTTELRQIHSFPRAQWRKVARGDFSVTTIAERMRQDSRAIEPLFRSKIDALIERLLRDDPDLGTVVLIGVNASEPLTVIDGNHRLMAAILAAPEGVQRLRFLCGLSPRMSACCWYNTNLLTLLRYGKNSLAHIVRDPEIELARLLRGAGSSREVRDPEVPESGPEEGGRELVDRTTGMRAVAVKRLPDVLSVQQKVAFLHEIGSVMNASRPRLVLDCSGLRACDSSMIHLLLHCLEEAMKRNGDVKLAGVPAAAAIVLVSTGVARLFETYDTTAEAVNSFHQLPSTKDQRSGCLGPASEEAA